MRLKENASFFFCNLSYFWASKGQQASPPPVKVWYGIPEVLNTIIIRPGVDLVEINSGNLNKNIKNLNLISMKSILW